MNSKFALVKTERGLELKYDDRLSLFIDFINDKFNYHRKFTSPKTEVFAKALGWNAGSRSVLDLTAGLGIDAVFAAQLGFKVVALERNEAVYALLKDAQERSQGHIKGDLKFSSANAKDYLATLKIEDAPDTIYYDPMYPHEKKSALPNKNMQVFRELIGTDEAEESIVKLALKTAKNRVVIKRPLKAPFVLANPNLQLKGKLVRYDVYFAK